MENSFSNGDFLFSIGPIFISIIFIIVIGGILFTIIKSISQWRKNENSPRLSVPAIISAKRTNVRTGAHGPNQMPRSHTDYYVTFEFESKDRLELELSGKEYGMLAEGDVGMLTFQGTRYISFSRQPQNMSEHN